MDVAKYKTALIYGEKALPSGSYVVLEVRCDLSYLLAQTYLWGNHKYDAQKTANWNL